MNRVTLGLIVGLVAMGLLGAGSARGQALLTSEPQLAIPDDGGGPACVDSITFTQTQETIGAFRVGLVVQHSWQAQLHVLLLPPGVSWPSATYSATEIPSAVSAGAIELVSKAGDDNDDIGNGWSQPYSFVSLTSAGDPVFDPGFLLTSVDTASGTGLEGEWIAHDSTALAAVVGQDPADYSGLGGTWTLVVIDDTATEDKFAYTDVMLSVRDERGFGRDQLRIFVQDGDSDRICAQRFASDGAGLGNPAC